MSGCSAHVVRLVLASVVGLLMPGHRSDAADRIAVLSVYASVPRRADVRIDYQAARLRVSAADIDRGYAEVAAGSRFAVVTNSRAGYVMDFYPVGTVFESVQIDGLGGAVELRSDGGSVVRRSRGVSDGTHELGYRFILRAGVTPGEYAWPLVLFVRAL